MFRLQALHKIDEMTAVGKKLRCEVSSFLARCIQGGRQRGNASVRSDAIQLPMCPRLEQNHSLRAPGTRPAATRSITNDCRRTPQADGLKLSIREETDKVTVGRPEH